MRRAGASLAAAAVLVCALIGPARASAEDLANEIAAKVMSPFCPGVTLENCPSDKAVALRARIESWAQDGWGEERIMDELVELYGDPIRALPPARGSGLWAWLAPGIALLGGAVLAIALARRWSGRPRATTSDDAAAVSAETRARLKEELDALRGGP
jgi:cytochrome c-type biogenesis protein CcmH/NrfF